MNFFPRPTQSTAPDASTWCRCGLHLARAKGGLCPTCADEVRKGEHLTNTPTPARSKP